MDPMGFPNDPAMFVHPNGLLGTAVAQRGEWLDG